ncbi:MAG: 3'(2'),5'-bisphosphate nucleotidase CysQ [Micromonosporaceae bacterium]|nr:3'(2'),5'-bisphosphate nucleotidase CysQ [Micromonosporaceae bacterium]
MAEDGSPPQDDARFAAWLAERAGALLLALREELGHTDPKALRDAGDQRSHELLMEAFAAWRPDDAVLSEEGADDPARLDAERVWIVDPLDGTREYSEEGRTDWAVHVALWRRGVPAPGLVAGAVALPAQGVVLASDRAAPARAEAGGAIRIAVSRTRPPEFMAALASELGAELVPMGSAGAKVCAVAQGTVEAYVHAGGQYEWDSAAPVSVALATGHYASRLDGSTLEYNRPDPMLPDLVVCRPDIAPRLLAALKEVVNGAQQ